MNDFPSFAELVDKHFNQMSQHELFVVDIDKDALWEHYLKAFPEGTNEIYRERTEHDCSCCRHFIKNLGNVVSIHHGAVRSVWDIRDAQHPYDTVAGHMSALVHQAPIIGVFRTREGQFGAEFTREYTEGGETKKWHHFLGRISTRHKCADPATARGDLNTSAAMLKRALEELTIDALDTVLELIDNNSLYRGQEHRRAVSRFCELKSAYDHEPANKEILIWQSVSNPAARFRNTVIGTLATDLSNGVDLEDAVKMFESKVAPQNYKRPTKLITPRMVDNAMKTIDELGLEPALERRFAHLSDISVNDVLFVDNAVREHMRDGVRGLLMEEAKSRSLPKSNGQSMDVETFVQKVLPKAKSVDLALTNAAAGNFMSLTAPAHPDAPCLFKWGNNFAWSYDGNVTDSIKEKVKRAGGNVDAALRVSLAWFNYDDLDIHVIEPDGNHIYFSNKSGKLDVDMNAGGRRSRDPVENVCWTGRVPDGRYEVSIDQYQQRESIDVGFALEVEAHGKISNFTYDRAVKGKVPCLTLDVREGELMSILSTPHVVPGDAGQDKWGVRTETLVPVHTILTSPNHWNEASGHKHWFFILKDCKNPEPARGIYNEFLKPELQEHRKVFEVLGNKTKCPVTAEQLSGVGFTAARDDSVSVIVKTGSTERSYTISF